MSHSAPAVLRVPAPAPRRLTDPINEAAQLFAGLPKHVQESIAREYARLEALDATRETL